MMSEPASADLLGAGHALLAQWCVDLLSGKLVATNSEGKETVLRPTAAELSVIRAFFKDNNITAAPAKGNAIQALKEQLERKQHRRANLAPFNPETDIGDGNFGKMQ
jgi:hypothetical protein